MAEDEPAEEDQDEDEVPPQHLFLDTQFFIQYDFDFANAGLKGLADHGRSGRVRIVLPAVIEKEIRSHIGQRAREVAVAPRQPAIVRNSRLAGASERGAALDAKALEDEVVASFESLLKDCDVLSS